MPYEDVENLRPETKKMVDTWVTIYGDAKDVILGVESAGIETYPTRAACISEPTGGFRHRRWQGP